MSSIRYHVPKTSNKKIKLLEYPKIKSMNKWKINENKYY